LLGITVNVVTSMNEEDSSTLPVANTIVLHAYVTCCCFLFPPEERYLNNYFWYQNFDTTVSISLGA